MASETIFSQRMFAVVVGLLMFGSMIGYAFLNVSPEPTSNVPDIPVIVNRVLTTQEQIYVLRTGRVLIENFYAENCTFCPERSIILNGFATRLSGYVVLQSVEENETSLQMIGVNGKIVPFREEVLNETFLTEEFCEIAILQPRECLMMDL